MSESTHWWLHICGGRKGRREYPSEWKLLAHISGRPDTTNLVVLHAGFFEKAERDSVGECVLELYS